MHLHLIISENDYTLIRFEFKKKMGCLHSYLSPLLMLNCLLLEVCRCDIYMLQNLTRSPSHCPHIFNDLRKYLFCLLRLQNESKHGICERRKPRLFGAWLIRCIVIRHQAVVASDLSCFVCLFLAREILVLKGKTMLFINAYFFTVWIQRLFQKGIDAKNPVFRGLRTTKAQTSLRIRAV